MISSTGLYQCDGSDRTYGAVREYGAVTVELLLQQMVRNALIIWCPRPSTVGRATVIDAETGY